MSEIKKIAVLTSGGDAPGMNSAIRAVVFSAARFGIEVVGIFRGYEGLIDWETIKLEPDDVRNINNRGGTILYTSRSERFLDEKFRKQAADNLRKNNVDAVVAIGGDGTLRGAIDFEKEGINIACIPGTIDRDVSCSEYTLGFDTAANTATEAIDKIRDSSISHGRCSVVEVMGRKRGYIALWAGMATSADAIILGYIQRGGQPSAKDRMYGSLMGAYAVEILMNGNKNRIVAIKDDKLIDYSINEALNIQNSQIDSFQYKLSLLLSD